MELIKFDDQNEILDEIRKNINTRHKKISDKVTPASQIKQRPDGMDYLEEAYMRRELTKEFPIWSWENGQFVLLGSEWIISSGTLTIEDNGIVRKFFSTGAARIQFKKGAPHTPENVIDIDKNVASANTNAFKRAINRLCNIGDDVYRKQDEELNEEELKNLIELARKLPQSRQATLQHSIDNGTINKSNYEKTIARIKKEIQ